MRRLSPKLLIQNTIPPALLMYFGWAWRRTLFRGAYEYICVHLGQPWIGALYGLATTLVPAMSALYLRLYFLPASQSLPPRHPPTDMLDLATVFECVPPTRALRAGHALIPRGSEAEDVGLLARCTRDTCAGRWKPARARHCSECGVCRCAFDHHCAFFANCLTAPHLPTFLALCFSTPAVVVLLSLPFLPSLLPRVLAAWRASYTAQEALQWWNWKWSWVVAAGPVGRYAVGLALGWHALDVADGGGPAQLLTIEIGLLVGISYILAAITSALGYSTLKNVRAGALTVDYERVRAHTRALAAADAFRAKGLPVPLELEDKIARFAPVHYFFIPVTNPQYAGVVIRAPANPYNLGASNNFELVVSRGFGARWILPWNALCTGIPERETHNWPVAPAALRYMKEEAERIVREVAEEEDVGNVSVQSAPRRPGPDRLAYTRL